jgi:hypothetical protein
MSSTEAKSAISQVIATNISSHLQNPDVVDKLYRINLHTDDALDNNGNTIFSVALMLRFDKSKPPAEYIKVLWAWRTKYHDNPMEEEFFVQVRMRNVGGGAHAGSHAFMHGAQRPYLFTLGENNHAYCIDLLLLPETMQWVCLSYVREYATVEVESIDVVESEAHGNLPIATTPLVHE